MTNKPEAKKSSPTPATGHPGMMGDGSEEQNLGQPGNPEARIKKDEVTRPSPRPRRNNALHPQSREVRL